VSDKQEQNDDLDALVAAPKHHRLLFENELVRVLDTKIAPGETVPPHTHRWASALYILSWSDFVRRDGDGNISVDSRTMGDSFEGNALWSPPLALHTLENVGDKEFRAISVEVKGAT
jgi:hypothetical protein